MNLEQLQSLSNAELNELAAVKVMEWVKEETDYCDQKGNYMRGDATFWNHPDVWNPTIDMNDAMELLMYFKSRGYKFSLVDHYYDNGIMCYCCNIMRQASSKVGMDSTSASRAITIASILAKEDTP